MLVIEMLTLYKGEKARVKVIILGKFFFLPSTAMMAASKQQISFNYTSGKKAFLREGFFHHLSFSWCLITFLTFGEALRKLGGEV